MDKAIIETSLKLLAFETKCDVILSCQDRKLEAHKVILSIASPVMRDLLSASDSPAFLIFPDVSSRIMILILDYIYAGSVAILSIKDMKEFVNVASLMGIKLEEIENKERLKNEKLFEDNHLIPAVAVEKEISKKTIKKIPNLMPLSAVNQKYKNRKGLYNQASPSPWCPRNVPLLASPRDVPQTILNDGNDSNNNNDATALVVKNKIGRINVSTFPIEKDRENSDGRISKVQNLEEENNRSSSPSSFSQLSQESKQTEEETTKKTKQFQCQDCGKSFSQLRNYKYHRSIHEGTKEFAARCPECGKIFNDKGYLSSHLKIHRDRKEYACPDCPKRFNQKVAYNMHLRVHSGVKPHECPTCGKGFSRKMLLKQHERVHTGERPYSCPECGKTFADRSNMSLHQRLHTGVKPYTCTLCPKSFTKKHHLKTHMNFHTGLKPYSCQNCGLAFSQSSNMRTHYKKCVLTTPTRNLYKTEEDVNE